MHRVADCWARVMNSCCWVPFFWRASHDGRHANKRAVFVIADFFSINKTTPISVERIPFKTQPPPQMMSLTQSKAFTHCLLEEDQRLVDEDSPSLTVGRQVKGNGWRSHYSIRCGARIVYLASSDAKKVVDKLKGTKNTAALLVQYLKTASGLSL